jgi:hypothetical protein
MDESDSIADDNKTANFVPQNRDLLFRIISAGYSNINPGGYDRDEFFSILVCNQGKVTIWILWYYLSFALESISTRCGSKGSNPMGLGGQLMFFEQSGNA